MKKNKSESARRINEHGAAVFSDRAVNEYKAAEILGRSVQTLRNARFQRKGCVYVKTGRSISYLLSDLQDYLQKHRIVPEG